MQEGGHLAYNMSLRAGSNQQTPSPTSGGAASRSRQHARRSVIFTPALQVCRYPPAVWGDDEEEDDDDEWDVGGYEDEDPSLAEDMLAEQERRGGGGGDSDDGMSWEEALPDPSRVMATEEDQRRHQELQAQQVQQQQQFQQRQEAEEHAAQLEHQQRQQIEEQRRQQQLVTQPTSRQAPDTVTQRSTGLSIHTSGSRDHIIPLQEASSSSSPSTPSTSRSLDPAEALETKKISMTPSVAQDNNQRGQALRQPQPRTVGPLLPSEVMLRQEEERKRTREEIEALEEAARKKAKTPSSGRPTGGPAKLRKEPQSSGDEDSGKERDKKGKSGGLFGRLFDRRKDKHKEKGSSESIDSGRGNDQRGSEESGRSSNNADAGIGPQTPPRRGAAPAVAPSPVSQHATSLRQRDKEQQTLYQQQYLTRSPASPPEAQSALQISPGSLGLVALGLGNASSTLSPSSDGRRPRPGSLLIGGNISGDGSSSVPELSVIRVFAGKKLQTEATFKTVLLNSSTSSEELVKQAIQRFRLPAGEDATDYYLTVKRLEGSSAVLHPNEKPLVVFETLAEAALDLPKVKRSSVGSISSIASNLSQHPAIKKLPMNDFTDDTAVKIYLNRRAESGSEESVTLEEGDNTISTESRPGDEQNIGLRLRTQYLGASVASERFSSPSFRFALQLMIYPDDLPDDMVFDPLTEAIVFKHTLRDRAHAPASSAPFRRKIFVFPKNVTVAEVIEIGLERFGIPDGVADGGDEVEDKNTKRRSSSRVRYVLNVLVDSKGGWRPFFRCPLCSRRPFIERELTPPGKVIDAYPRPPAYRPADRRSIDSKRRSFDSMQLLGSPEDVNAEDPVFILRRAVTYRTSSSRHRLSAPLDEIALQKMHRESVSSSSIASEDNDTKRHISKQELIAAQRAATRANQRAILSAQANSQRGVDVFLPNNAVLRSSRYDTDERTRYSYVEGGETYDISDIMEEEWDSSSGKGDLLEGVLSRGGARDGVDEKLHRVLSKIKGSRTIQRSQSSPPDSASTEDSVYSSIIGDEALQSAVERSRSATPVGADNDSAPRAASPASERTVTPELRRRRSATSSSASHGRSTPQQQVIQPQQPHLRQISIASVATTDSSSGYRTAVGSPSSPSPAKVALRQRKPKVTLPKDDFGVSHMMAIIELSGLQDKPAPLPPLNPVDEMLFGRPLNLDELHPAIKEIYAPTLKQLDEMGQASVSNFLRVCVLTDVCVFRSSMTCYSNLLHPSLEASSCAPLNIFSIQ
jgi:hypothetical protein